MWEDYGLHVYRFLQIRLAISLINVMSFSRCNFTRSKKTAYTLDMIEPNLYLSGESEASSVETLKRYKITHILTINDYPLSPSVKDALSHLQIKYIRLSDLCSSDLLSYLDETYEFIREGISKGSILVHCQMGVSRSATVVIGYIMKKYRLTYREALDRVKSKRCVYPNMGFVSQLQSYKDLGYTTLSMYTPRRTRYTCR